MSIYDDLLLYCSYEGWKTRWGWNLTKKAKTWKEEQKHKFDVHKKKQSTTRRVCKTSQKITGSSTKILKAGRWEDEIIGDLLNSVSEMTFARWKWQNNWVKLKANKAWLIDDQWLTKYEQRTSSSSSTVVQTHKSWSQEKANKEQFVTYWMSWWTRLASLNRSFHEILATI